jgi:hypothetical protein
MSLEDLAAITDALRRQAEQERAARRKEGATEPMTCTLASGQAVTFDVPNTRRNVR